MPMNPVLPMSAMEKHGLWKGFALVSAGLLLVAGCAEPYELAPVHGKVTVDDTPLNQGSVVFTPVAKDDGSHPGRAAAGRIGSDGQFRLTTYEKGDGAIVGDHWAVVINHEEEVPDGVPEFVRVSMPDKLTVESGTDNQIDLKFTREQVRKYREDD
jgi:hypothetical protein